MQIGNLSPNLSLQESEEAAVKLTEIGPRMNLTLMKVEDGFCAGEVRPLPHQSVSTTR